MTDPSNIRTFFPGRAIPLRGNDIDTDRIIPARFLRCVTFDGLGEHVFEDDRRGLKAKSQTHAFDNSDFQGASILFVNKNFGCGSSREHAPQALMRWGITAIVGESFAEIFFGNCVAMGIPCVTVDEATMENLMQAAQKDSNAGWTLDLETQKLNQDGEMRVAGINRTGLNEESITFSIPRYDIFMPEGPRSQFLSGQWNPMNELLTHLAEVDHVAANLPYVSGRW